MTDRTATRVATWICAATSFYSPVARAADVAWQAPPGCPPADIAVKQAEQLVGRSLRSIANIDFNVRVTRAGSRWNLVLTTIQSNIGERRTREIEGESCREVVDAVGLAMAMSVRAAAEERQETSQPSPVIEPPSPEVIAPREREMAPSREADSRRPLHIALAVAVALDTGALPASAFGPSFDIALRREALSLRAQVAWFLPQRTRSGSGPGAELELAIVGLAGCGALPVLGWTLLACGSFEIGRLFGHGLVTRSRSGGSTWVAPGAEVGLSLPLNGALSLLVRGGAAVPLMGSDFVVNAASVHRPAAITGRGSVGIALFF